MKQELKSSKLQMKVTNPASSKAIHRLINNVVPDLSDGQLSAITTSLKSLTDDDIQDIVIAISSEVELEK